VSGSPAGRSFSTQYLSLILIILTFIIGIFSSNHLQKQRLTLPMEASRVALDSLPDTHSALEFNDLFGPGTAELREEKLTAVVSLLRAHDLDAEFLVRADEGMASREALALARVTTFLRALLAEGVPLHALSVVATEATDGPQVRMLFQRSSGQ
jgi:hypothetical protein